MPYYHEPASPKYQNEVKALSLPLSQEINKIKKKMEQSNKEQHFPKTPKILTNVQNPNPIEKPKKIHELCNAKNYEINRVGDTYTIKEVGEENSKELAFELYKSFAQSEFVQIAKEMRQAQVDFYNAKKHMSSNKQELLQKALRLESDFDKLLQNLFNYVQKQLF